MYAHLDAARDEVLAFTGFPRGLWRQIWSNNPNEHLPDRGSIIRLVGAVLAEQNDEWATDAATSDSRSYPAPELP